MPGMMPATTSSSAPAGQFNDADIAFASQMIPHHQQAVQMADMAIRKATAPAVKQLATAIKAAQDPEIKLMSGWLTTWDKPVPTPLHGHDMSALMVKHYQGAVTMAKTEQAEGKEAAAIALAKKIETDQNREIATMQRLMGQLPVS
jgi:uncharacterized protein (DUF305 family)